MPRSARTKHIRIIVSAVIAAGILASGAVYAAARDTGDGRSGGPDAAATPGPAPAARARTAPPGTAGVPAAAGGSGRTADGAAPAPTTASPPSASASAPTGTAASRSRSGGARALAMTQLAPSQIPSDDTRRWQAMTAPHMLPLTGDFALNECAAIAGATAWRQQGFISAQQTPAVQDALSFASPAAAHTAYTKLLADMGSCRRLTRDYQAKYGLAPDATVTRTAATPDGTAWARHWTGVQGISADGVQTNHIYAVQRGSVLTLLHVDEWARKAAPPYDTGGDPDVLRSLADKLPAN